jgi:hypothetical protein
MSEIKAAIKRIRGDLVEDTQDMRDMYDELWLIASNDGESYRKRDAKGAIEKAWAEYQKNERTRMREDFKEILPKLKKDLERYWKKG